MLKGAEAELKPAIFFSIPCLVKVRGAKLYRAPQLDKQLRLERTKVEGRLLHKAKLYGVRCPLVLGVDVDKCELYLSKLSGELLARGKHAGAAYNRAGEQLALLHIAGVSHGDSTTSNFMVDTTGKVWLFDFGLAQPNPSLEEEAIDLLLFQKSVTSSQFRRFLVGYSAIRGAAVKSLLSKVAEIQLRARYAER